MPSYRWIVPRDSVPFEKRQVVAKACTDIHCGSTGAPRSFVHVTFHEYDDESEFATPYYLDAGNRAGRTEEVKRKLMSDLLGTFQRDQWPLAGAGDRPAVRGTGSLVDGRRKGTSGGRRRGSGVVRRRGSGGLGVE